MGSKFYLHKLRILGPKRIDTKFVDGSRVPWDNTVTECVCQDAAPANSYDCCALEPPLSPKRGKVELALELLYNHHLDEKVELMILSRRSRFIKAI